VVIDGGRDEGRVAGGAILHPVTLAAVGLLLLNDHVLKVAYPGFVTGKLSDIAGLAFFPLLLVGLWEVLLTALGRWTGPTVRAVIAAVLLTAALFILVKTTDAGSEAFGLGLGLGQWVPGAVLNVLTARPIGAPDHALVVLDPTDLAALPALAVPLAVGLVRARAVRLARRPLEP
jgi:hypothetical protein